jgi:macrolide transport system ATP-binding/permease protein
MPDPSRPSGSPRPFDKPRVVPSEVEGRATSRGDWTPALSVRLARLSLRPAREQEIIEELSQHLDDRYEELRTGGATHEAAMREAIDEIDDEDLLRREMRELRQASRPEPIVPGAPRNGLLGGTWQDLVYAARMLRKHRGFAAAAIVTLALGIGANTAIFSLVNATLFQRLPVQNRDRLDYLFSGNSWTVLSYPGYTTLRDGATLFDGIAAWGGITASLNADGETDLVSGAIVTGNLFDLIGVSAHQGRMLAPSDDVVPGGHPVAVISHRLWQNRFGSRANIVGTQVRLNGGLFTIVGVARPEFPGPQLGTLRDVYVPMMMQALMRPPRAGYSGEQNPDLLRNPGNSWLYQLARRKPGVTREQAQAELVAIATTYVRGRNPNARPPRLVLVPIDAGDVNQRNQMRSVATLLGFVVGAVLLIACANVANLLLSKAAARRREVAIRLALGASRWRIVRQLLTESVLLSVLGGAGGVVLAWLVVRGFEAAPPPPGALPIALDFSVDRRVLVFSLGLSLLTGILFGLAPALQASRPGLVPALKDDAFAPDGRGRRFNLKKALVVAEVALSLLLLIAAGLFVRSLKSVQTIDPGYPVMQLVSAPLNVNLLRYTRAQGREFYQRVVERMEALPGVEAASFARVPLLTGSNRVTSILVEGRSDPGTRSQSEGGAFHVAADESLANVIGPGFFQTLGIPLIRGRDFDERDREARPLVAIVNETMARIFFPNEDALGKRFKTGAVGDLIEIVGIVRDAKYTSLSETPTAMIYQPLAQQHETGVTLYVRAIGSAAALVAQVRREIQTLEPNLPVPNIQTMRETIGTSLYAPRMGAMLLTIFSGLALLLASLGVYGVLAFSISRRRREIGIRMALGADRRQVFGLVIREGMWLVGLGLAIGMAGGLYASESIERFLFDVSARDLTTFATVPWVLAAVALLACYLPARRAMGVDPMVALRDT